MDTFEKYIKIIKQLNVQKYKSHFHYTCWAGSVIQRVDKWGEKEIYKCSHKGKNDWGIVGTNRKESPCKKCSGKLKGFLDLTDYEMAYNNGIDKAINIIQQNMG